jgi:hypothetical protein
MAVLTVAAGLAGPLLAQAAERPERPWDYWSRPRRGANFFNRVETAERLRAAAGFGIEFARIAPDKWTGAGRDFLLGDADDFRGVPPADLALLRRTLDDAHAAGIEVVLTMLSLPGARWRQHNGNRSDFRLYREPRFAEQAAAFWKELAKALRGHPALVGYNLLNEPHPELMDGSVDEATFDFPAFAGRVRGTAADLHVLYAGIARAIRQVDPDIPLILDCGLYATPPALAALRPLPDPLVLYAIHMYEPFVYTNHRRNRGRFRYPGVVAIDPDDPAAGQRRWDADALARFLEPVKTWQRAQGMAAGRILVGEFGVDRRAAGADRYLRDLIGLFASRGWHQAFYAFREDTWDAMDYEIGPHPLPASYWKAREEGRSMEPPRGDNPIWRAMLEGLRGREDPRGGPQSSIARPSAAGASSPK